MSLFNLYIDEFLKKQNAEQARRHLEIGGTPSGNGGSGDSSLPSSTVAALAGTASTPSAANRFVTNVDPRNFNARTPTAHAGTHSNGSSDSVNVTNLAGFPGGGTTFLRDDGTFAVAGGGGSGTVTSVALTAPSILSVAGSPVTTAGTLALSLANQNANLVFAGPATGAAAAPTFRSLVASDLPSTVSAWDVVITKSADQTVTNDATPQADTELFTALVAGAFYEIQLLLLFSGNDTTGDYQASFAYPTVTNNLNMGFCNNFNASNAAVIAGRAGAANQWPSTAEPLGVVVGDVIRTSFLTFFLRTEAAAGNLQYQFANAAAGVGRTSTTRAGSTLRVKRLV